MILPLSLISLRDSNHRSNPGKRDHRNRGTKSETQSSVSMRSVISASQKFQNAEMELAHRAGENHQQRNFRGRLS